MPRRDARTVAKAPAEGAGFGIAHDVGDLRQRHVGFRQQLARADVGRFIRKVAKRDAHGLQAPIQRPPVHVQQVGRAGHPSSAA